MNIIFSRKGFDSQYGGMPSPILPDGRLVPLPIPSSRDTFTLAAINIPEVDIDKLVAQLSNGTHTANSLVHLDPDLNRDPSSRKPGWRPALGQTGSAQSHLSAEGVGKGDLFLFFGWFRRVEYQNGTWRYIRSAPHLHVIFGWLEVSDVLPIVRERSRCIRQYPWIVDHPHVSNPAYYTDPRNTLYVARPTSRLTKLSEFGGGRFNAHDARLTLTKPGSSRSIWSLPKWVMPTNQRAPLTYHRNPTLWRRDGEMVTLKTAPKGQEFVLHAGDYPEASIWLAHLFEDHFPLSSPRGQIPGNALEDVRRMG